MVFIFFRSKIGAVNNNKRHQRTKLEKIDYVQTEHGVLPYHVATLISYHEEAERRQSQFLFVPLPKLNGGMGPFISLLRKHGVQVASIPEKYRKRGGEERDWFWFSEDSHWRPQAVSYTAEIILESIGLKLN